MKHKLINGMCFMRFNLYSFSVGFLCFLLTILNIDVYGQAMVRRRTYSIDKEYLNGIGAFVLADDSPRMTIDNILLTCTYTVTRVTDTLNIQKKSTDRMILDIGSKHSRFYSAEVERVDSLRRDAMEKKTYKVFLFDNPDDRIYTQVIKKYPDPTKTTVLDRLSQFWCYEDIMSDMNWKIEPDSAVILTYPCQKASCLFRGRLYEAWFTTEIPLSEGPWKFHGLPGLILKVRDSHGYYSFECIGIEKSVGKKIQISSNIPKQKKRNQKEYAKIERRFYKDPVGFIKSAMIENWSFDVYDTSNPSDPKELNPGSISIPYNPLELE